MGKKVIIVLLILLLIGGFAGLGFYYHNEISNFIEEENWMQAKPYVEKNLEYSTVFTGNTNIFVVNGNNLSIYNKNLDQEYTEKINTNNVSYYSNGSYTVVASSDKGFIKLFKGSDLYWTKDVVIDIKSISLNKNGYMAIVFTQNGYKSGVKVYSNTGSEVITMYLASSYAVSAKLSEDNSFLYIAEVDANGINLKSDIKIINLKAEDSESSAKVIEVGSNEMVTNVEVISPEIVYVITNKSIYYIDANDILTIVCTLDEKNTIYANIENVKVPFRIDKGDNVCISYGEELSYKIEMDSEPTLFDSIKDKCAFFFNDEVWIVNSECQIIKKCELETSNLMSLKFFNNGDTLALMYNGRIELIKI